MALSPVAAGRPERTYRYYTCFSLAAFYTQDTRLITAATTPAQAHSTGRQAEADAITAQIKNKETAIARYHTALENGTMDDTTAGPRLAALRDEIALLHARHGELTDTIDTTTTPPAAALT